MINERDLIKKLVAAVECSQALDMPTREGEMVLERHGWSRDDRFDRPATKFVGDMMREAMVVAREAGYK